VILFIRKYGLFPVFILYLPVLTRGQVLQQASGAVAGISTIAAATVADSALHNNAFVVGEITVTGNRKTKDYIIERELTFKTGDSIYLPNLVTEFQRSKELLINTRLFNEVVIALKSFRGYVVDVLVEVKERWYIFPIPYFKPIDRNLSVWADKGYRLDRINYGLKFYYNNFTGRNDKLKLWVVTGYARQLQIAYDQPYADKSLKHGYGFNISYSAQKEINAGTVNNEQRFLRADTIAYAGKFLDQSVSFSLRYFYRPALRTVHSVQLGYNVLKIDSAVTIVNPKYFSNGGRQLQYPELSYSISYQKVDYIPYVLKGFMGDASLIRKGINKSMNLWQLNGRFTRGWSLGWNSYFGIQGNGTLRLPFDQPFINQRMFGYTDQYLRGLEKYVIDGVAGVLIRNTLRRKMLDLKIPFGLSGSHNVLPLKVYVKTYADMGYVYNKYVRTNSLVNQLLYTAGAGVDVVTLYDLVFRFEYSANQLGQRGLFFHIRNDF
jgi:outer membrane protein assembly factor BamA